MTAKRIILQILGILYKDEIMEDVLYVDHAKLTSELVRREQFADILVNRGHVYLMKDTEKEAYEDDEKIQKIEEENNSDEWTVVDNKKNKQYANKKETPKVVEEATSGGRKRRSLPLEDKHYNREESFEIWENIKKRILFVDGIVRGIRYSHRGIIGNIYIVNSAFFKNYIRGEGQYEVASSEWIGNQDIETMLVIITRLDASAYIVSSIPEWDPESPYSRRREKEIGSFCTGLHERFKYKKLRLPKGVGLTINLTENPRILSGIEFNSSEIKKLRIITSREVGDIFKELNNCKIGEFNVHFSKVFTPFFNSREKILSEFFRGKGVIVDKFVLVIFAGFSSSRGLVKLKDGIKIIDGVVGRKETLQKSINGEPQENALKNLHKLIPVYGASESPIRLTKEVNAAIKIKENSIRNGKKQVGQVYKVELELLNHIKEVKEKMILRFKGVLPSGFSMIGSNKSPGVFPFKKEGKLDEVERFKLEHRWSMGSKQNHTLRKSPFSHSELPFIYVEERIELIKARDITILTKVKASSVLERLVITTSDSNPEFTEDLIEEDQDIGHNETRSGDEHTENPHLITYSVKNLIDIHAESKTIKLNLILKDKIQFVKFIVIGCSEIFNEIRIEGNVDTLILLENPCAIFKKILEDVKTLEGKCELHHCGNRKKIEVRNLKISITDIEIYEETKEDLIKVLKENISIENNIKMEGYAAFFVLNLEESLVSVKEIDLAMEGRILGEYDEKTLVESMGRLKDRPSASLHYKNSHRKEVDEVVWVMIRA